VKHIDIVYIILLRRISGTNPDFFALTPRMQCPWQKWKRKIKNGRKALCHRFTIY